MGWEKQVLGVSEVHRILGGFPHPPNVLSVFVMYYNYREFSREKNYGFWCAKKD